MKCFLHIGTEKTATTTIQNFLHLNRQGLLDKGYIYTKSAGLINNRALPVLAYNSSRRDDFTRGHFIDSDSKLISFQKERLSILKNEILEITKNSNSKYSVIFSSEHLQSRLTELEEIERLKHNLYHLGITDIKVIVYLRRPADLANSLYSTAIKAGLTKKTPSHPTAPYFNNVCNHQKTIERFASVFGQSSLNLRIFDQEVFVNQSIIDDFLSVIPLKNTNFYSLSERANTSLSTTGILLLRRLNELVPKWIDDKPNPARANLVSYFEKYFSGSKYVMPSYLYREYDEEFQASNEWVRKKFFPEKDQLFSNEIPLEKEEISIPDIDSIAKLLADIWIDKQKMK